MTVCKHGSDVKRCFAFRALILCKHKFEKALKLKTQQVKQELIICSKLHVQGFVSGGIIFSFTKSHNFLRIVNL